VIFYFINSNWQLQRYTVWLQVTTWIEHTCSCTTTYFTNANDER